MSFPSIFFREGNVLRKFKPFLNLFVLLTFISFIFQTHLQASPITPIKKVESTLEREILQGDPFTLSLFSFDEIVNFIESLEKDDLEWRYSEDEIDKINCWLATLAREGQLFDEDEDSLELDIAQLFFPSYKSSFAIVPESNYLLSPAIYCDQDAQLLLIGFFKELKKVGKAIKYGAKTVYKGTTDFIVEHKKEIIIGAVILIAGAITYATCAPEECTPTPIVPSTAPSEPASEGISSIFTPDLQQSPKESLPSLGYTVSLQENLDENIVAFKETLIAEEILESSNDIEQTNPSIWNATKEQIREHGSTLAHVVIDGVSEQFAKTAEILDSFVEISNNIIPFDDSEELSGRAEVHEKHTYKAHQIIDQIFATNQALEYTKEAKEYRDKQFTKGIIPFPSGLVGQAIIPKTLANATRGWKVGQPINNLTKIGKVPKWNAVRQRFWKNKAYSNPKRYSPSNLKRMKKGLAPQQRNKLTGQIESKELHHIPPQRDGGLFDVIEVWPDEHAELDKYRHLKK